MNYRSFSDRVLSLTSFHFEKWLQVTFKSVATVISSAALMTVMLHWCMQGKAKE